MTADGSSVVLRNDVAELPRAHEALHAFLRERGAGPGLVFDADLVLEEIVTNLVKYGWPDGGDHRITFTFEEVDGELVLRFEDDGAPFDPRSAPRPVFPEALELRRPGGLGLHLVRSTARRIAYRSEDGVNHLEVVLPLR